MTHAVWDPPAGSPMSEEQLMPLPSTVGPDGSELGQRSVPSEGPCRADGMNPRTTFDRSSFFAGEDSGTRIAACVARLAALELMDASRWWNRRRHRFMASALVACAEELEGAADANAGDRAALDAGDP